MRYAFPYQWAPPIEIPDANLLGVFERRKAAGGRPGEEIVRRALREPIGARPLRECLRAGQRVLVLVDDYTRATPKQLLLPPVLDEIAAAGVADEDITLLVALGTHRAMTHDEMCRHFGEALVCRFRILNHEWDNPGCLVDMGSADGVRIHINRAARQADFMIGLGQIFPHIIAGFSGGGKIVTPGICGEVTNGDMHWDMAGPEAEEYYGVRDTAVRRVIDRVATQAGLAYIVNVIVDTDRRIASCVAGHPIKAHRRGCELAREFHSVRLPARADIVIADSLGNDIDLWQACKSYGAAALAMKPGGVVIEVAECPEGVSPVHECELLEHCYPPTECIVELVAKGRVSKSVGTHMVNISRVIADRGKGFIITQGIPREKTERLGFLWADTPQQALDEALRMKGPDATIAVLRESGEMLPIIEGETVSPFAR